MAKNQVLRVLVGCNRQLLSIKIYAGIANIFRKVHNLLKLRASNKGIKQILFLLFLNLFHIKQPRKSRKNIFCKSTICVNIIIIFKVTKTTDSVQKANF